MRHWGQNLLSMIVLFCQRRIRDLLVVGQSYMARSISSRTVLIMHKVNVEKIIINVTTVHHLPWF